MRLIYKNYNVDYNIVSYTLNFNSQIRFENISNKHRQRVGPYKSRRTNLYKKPTEFPGSKDGPQIQ